MMRRHHYVALTVAIETLALLAVILFVWVVLL